MRISWSLWATRFVASLFFVLLILFPSSSFAQENWQIDKFQSNISVLGDGNVRITETIDVDFGSLQKHGIFRDLPYVYQSEDGGKIYTKITVAGVFRDNLSTRYEVSKSGGFMRLKIGEPSLTISGKHEYKIEYLAAGILRSFADHDELYWNATGNGWPVPISEASVKVRLPDSGINQTTCFEGRFGSREICKITQVDNNEVVFQTSKGLGVGEGLSVVVGYTKGLVPILQVDPPKSLEEELFSPVNFAVFFLSLFLGIGFIFRFWWKNGRDFWWRQKYAFDKQAIEEVKPLDAHETIVVEFTTPENLRPAEIGTLADERADTLDVSSTIIDLATRGFLTITEEPKKWLFGKTDYILVKKPKDTQELFQESGNLGRQPEDEAVQINARSAHKAEEKPWASAHGSLLAYEKELFNRLFDKNDIISLSSLRTEFYDDLSIVKKKLYEDMLKKKFFVENPEKVRNKYLMIGVAVIFFGGLMLFLSASAGLFTVSAFSAGLLISGLFLLGFSRVMPRKTAHGREIYRRIRGYELFISTAEKYRQQFFERKNLFNEVLPYAIVFGLTEKFAQAFKSLGLEPPQPTWYVGTGLFNASSFSSNINSFSSSLSSAIAATPKGSGFSSGGGFSGGGFGGGGGGSW